jgi:hypothetical protein
VIPDLHPIIANERVAALLACSRAVARTVRHARPKRRTPGRFMKLTPTYTPRHRAGAR